MAGVSFMLPSWYRSSTSVFPPETKSSLPPLYADIMQSLSIPALGPSAIGARPSTIYIDVTWEESLRKNRLRFNPQRPDSVLEHSLPDEIVFIIMRLSFCTHY